MRAIILRTLRPVLTTLIPPLLDALKDQGPRLLESAIRSPQRRAWRTYAAAAVTSMSVNIAQDSHDDIPTLCRIASEIADEMVKREAEREGEEES